MKSFLVSVILLFLVGCGGSSSSGLADVDNSILAEGLNSYGYYGSEVLFGNQKIAGIWTIESSKTGDTVSLSFDREGTYSIENQEVGDYGVSVDGKQIRMSDGLTEAGMVITYKSTLKDNLTVYNADGTEDTYDCYTANLHEFTHGDATITMCPFR